MSSAPEGVSGPPPEAVLIRRAREASGLRQPDAIALLRRRGYRISPSRWSQIETGRDGDKVARGSASAVAHMASAVGLTPERLREARPDAAEVLEEIILREGTASASIPGPSVAGRGEVTPPRAATEEDELASLGAALTAEYPEFADFTESLTAEPNLTTAEKLGLLTMARLLRQARGTANGRPA